MAALKAILFFTVFLNTVCGVSAQKARFYIDTAKMHQYSGTDKNYEEVKKMQWRINNVSLSFTTLSAEVSINAQKPDTIFFKQNEDAKWDTILCDISIPGAYYFLYNTCCGGFDILDSATQRRIEGKVIFVLKKKTKKSVLGKIGDTGFLMKEQFTDTVVPICRSVMEPNVYWITIDEIVPGKADTMSKEELFCLYLGKNVETDYEFEYSITKSVARFLYLPVSNSPITIIYNNGTWEWK